jgi:hypothetical protein
MWLAIIWICLFTLHVLLFGMGIIDREAFQFFDRLVLYSCFILYGVMDSYQMNFRTILGFFAQFSFWWVIGLYSSILYAKLKRDLKRKSL